MTGSRPLHYEDGPLVWLDLETTGLDPSKNRIIEVAVLITNGDLQLVDQEGCHFVVKSNEQTLNEMDDWCTIQHNRSGLIAKTEESTLTAPEVADAVLAYIQKWVPKQRTALLAGSSVHFDAMFLRTTGPDVVEHGGGPIWKKIADHLHYRGVDVSSVKELCKRWYPQKYEEYQKTRPAQASHRAMDDIRGSIAELKFYREAIFTEPKVQAGSGYNE
ncbi:polyporopepsin [Ceratobasidium sp. AG-Ba]|nr:polyporopepsin [Ceratobasidium sp. AG-Ba]